MQAATRSFQAGGCPAENRHISANASPVPEKGARIRRKIPAAAGFGYNYFVTTGADLGWRPSEQGHTARGYRAEVATKRLVQLGDA